MTLDKDVADNVADYEEIAKGKCIYNSCSSAKMTPGKLSLLLFTCEKMLTFSP